LKNLRNRINRNRNRNRNNNKEPKYQFNKDISLNIERVNKNISAIYSVYGYITTSAYSFSNSSDSRSQTLGGILSASSEFALWSPVYKSYRINNVSITVYKVSQVSPLGTATLAPLGFTCDPNITFGAVTNLSNTSVMYSDASSIMPYDVIRPVTSRFKMAGVGTGIHTWYPTTLTSQQQGAIYIGSLGCVFATTTNLWFVLKVDLNIDFSNPY